MIIKRLFPADPRWGTPETLEVRVSVPGTDGDMRNFRSPVNETEIEKWVAEATHRLEAVAATRAAFFAAENVAENESRENARHERAEAFSVLSAWHSGTGVSHESKFVRAARILRAGRLEDGTTFMISGGNKMVRFWAKDNLNAPKVRG